MRFNFSTLSRGRLSDAHRTLQHAYGDTILSHAQFQIHSELGAYDNEYFDFFTLKVFLTAL